MRGSLVMAGIALATGAVLLSGAALAHHSIVGYEIGEEARITVAGTVQAFRFINPHAMILLEEETGEGSRTWALELNSPGNLLRREGWSHNVLRPGDRIRATFNPAREGRLVGVCVELELADGRELDSAQGCGAVR